MRYIIPLLLLSTAAFAEDKPQPPTVTLTQAELSALITAENTKAVSAFATQQEVAKAKGVYDKINAALAPKK